MQELTTSSVQQAKELAKALSRAELTPTEIQALPAQLLYVALLSAGEELLPDLVPFLNDTQYRLLLDFDFWEKDRFLPQRFVDWLQAIHAPDSLELYEQFLSIVPLDVLELVTQGLVQVTVHEEKTEEAPGIGWFTPDDGQLWLKFNVEDEYELRVLGQFFAYLFQRSPELFYQLMLNLNATTAMELEENSFNERQRRLLDAGLPDIDSQLEMQSPLPVQRALRMLREFEAQDVGTSGPPIPTVHAKDELQPLSAFLQDVASGAQQVAAEELLSELARILNAGMVFYRTALDEGDEVQLFQQQVRGLVNLGLQRLATQGQFSARQIYHALSLQGLYRLGLAELSPLRSAAIVLEPLLEEKLLDRVQECFAHPIPLYPRAWVTGTTEQLSYFDEVKPFEHLEEVTVTLERLYRELSAAHGE